MTKIPNKGEPEFDQSWSTPDWMLRSECDQNEVEREHVRKPEVWSYWRIPAVWSYDSEVVMVVKIKRIQSPERTTRGNTGRCKIMRVMMEGMEVLECGVGRTLGRAQRPEHPSTAKWRISASVMSAASRMKMTSPAELRNRKMMRITGTGLESRSRLFSQAPQLRRVCNCLGRSRNERRARMAKTSNRRLTGSPGVNQRWTGDELEDR
ncbi:hypothetical protein B0H10DRAFT_1965545 [Mycena sp. CBHHK59/15]|nr:hypothetical protein B0H10DRAFT_1965545 [Mycena sp. CBHHK59/15]